ncbi:hypothetical protein N320_07473, partial [Buceros rhinoceros silvestris]
LFEAGHLQPLEWAVYRDWHSFLLRHLGPHVTLHGFLYLRATPQVAAGGRGGGSGVQLGYLQQLHAQHEHWLVEKTTEVHFEDMKHVPVLVLDVDKDFEHDTDLQGRLMA